MKPWLRILPVLAGAAALAAMLRWLDLDWAALRQGDLGAVAEALRRTAEGGSASKAASILALAALLPFVLVPITVVLFAAALLLPAAAAVPVILGGALLNTALAFGLGTLYGGRLVELLGLERFAFFKAIRSGARNHGFKMALLSRFLPSPFVLQAMAAAAVGIRLWQMLLGTFIAMLPWAYLYTAFPEAIRKGDLKPLGPALGLLAVLAGLGWWARSKMKNPGPDEGQVPEAPSPLIPQSPPLGPELEFYTIKGDPACDDARKELERLRPLVGFEVRETEIGALPEMDALYREHVPLLMFEGEKLFSFQVDENLLKVRLKAWHAREGRP